MDEIPCLVCGELLETYWDTDGLQPLDGVAFAGRGHEESRYFHSTGAEVLQVVVCDGCLTASRERQQTFDEFEVMSCEQVVVGRVYLDREPRPFDGEADKSVRVVDIEDLGESIPGAYRVDWFEAAIAQVRAIHRRRVATARQTEQRRRTRTRARPETAASAPTAPTPPTGPPEAPAPVSEPPTPPEPEVAPVADLAPVVEVVTASVPEPPARPVPTPPRNPRPMSLAHYDPLADANDREERVAARRAAFAARANGHARPDALGLSDEEPDHD